MGHFPAHLLKQHAVTYCFAIDLRIASSADPVLEVARAFAACHQRITRGEAIVKITRPITGIMLELWIIQLVLSAGLFITSYSVDFDSPEGLKRIIFLSEMGALGVSFVVYLFTTQIQPKNHAQYQELMKHHGGTLRALVSRDYWHDRLRLGTPYIPLWLHWASLSIALFIALLAVIVFSLSLNNSDTYGDQVKEAILFPLIFSAMTLPDLLSKWRELSQPTATTSPEMSQS
jgi:hypothetical protein